MKTRSAILAAALGAALISATSAPAAADSAKGQASVSYSDLDLSAPAGRAELARRYDQAARDMCGAGDASQKLHGKQRFCYENTIRQLNQQVALILARHDAAGKTAVATR